MVDVGLKLYMLLLQNTMCIMFYNKTDKRREIILFGDSCLHLNLASNIILLKTRGTYIMKVKHATHARIY